MCFGIHDDRVQHDDDLREDDDEILDDFDEPVYVPNEELTFSI